MTKTRIFYLRSVFLAFTILALAAGCDTPDSITVSVVSPEPGSTPSPVVLVPTGNTSTILRTYKPALAVRGMSCLMCHAQIKSSIITDFGYGDAQFFMNQHAGTIYGTDQDPPKWGPAVINNANPLTLPWYGNYYGTWQLATRIEGSVVVPRATISDPDFLRLISWNSSSITLAELLNLDLGANFYGDAPYSGAGPITRAVTPVGANPLVTEIDRIYIGAPTTAQLLSLSASPSDPSPGWETLRSGESVSGLVVKAGQGGSYVTNSGPVLECKGDILIKGTLFLDDVTIDTDDDGCRLMVTQSAFLQGQILFASTSGTQNLQVSSARAVLMGFSVATLARRLGPLWYPDGQPLTRDVGTNTEKIAAIMAEARSIGSDLYDTNDAAHCPTSMVTYEAANGGGVIKRLTQCSINYQRLLINAPNFQSRYIGRFAGVVVAEIALTAPGALDFAYDPIFDSVPILPIYAGPVPSPSPSPVPSSTPSPTPTVSTSPSPSPSPSPTPCTGPGCYIPPILGV